MAQPNFLRELRRRHVWRVAIAYIVAAWLLLQLGAILFPAFGAPHWAIRLLFAFLVIGFPVAILFAWAFEMTPEGMRRTPSADAEAARPPEARRRVGRTLDFVIIAILAAAVGVLVWQRFATAPRTQAARVAATAAGTVTTTATAVPAPKAVIPAKSIAVLPFENLSPDKNNAYFADGIQDLILTKLAEIGGLVVISRTSTAKYQSHPEDLKVIGRQLGVANVLEGSVQKSGDQVLINMQLIDASDDHHIWAQSYQRTLQNIFGVEGEVAEKVAEELKAKLTNAEQQAVVAKMTDNPKAYDAYLRGLVAARNLAGLWPTALPKIEMDYAKAVALDPTFAQAWARLSEIRTRLYADFVDRSSQMLAGAKRAADTVLRLDPRLGEGYLALAKYHYLALRDMKGALAPLKKARRLLPNNADVLNTLGDVEERRNHWRKANTYLRMAVQLDPRAVDRLSDLSQSYAALREFAEAREILDRALVISPHNPALVAAKADVFQEQGDLDDAGDLLKGLKPQAERPRLFLTITTQYLYRRQYRKVIVILKRALTIRELHPPLLRAIYQTRLGSVLDLAGQHDAARAESKKALAELMAVRKSAADDHLLASFIAEAYAVLGKKGKALRWSRRDVAANATCSLCEAGAEAGLAAMQARFGDTDAALAALPHLLTVPNGPTVAEFRLDPAWDPIRHDPRFQALLKKYAKHKPAAATVPAAAAATTP